MYTTGKIGPLERKLGATEELLRIAKDEIAILERQLSDSRASHKMQQVNTGVFWEQARAAERKLGEVQGLCETEGDVVRLVTGIWKVLRG